jgi:hypothetical protein
LIYAINRTFYNKVSHVVLIFPPDGTPRAIVAHDREWSEERSGNLRLLLFHFVSRSLAAGF